ncbi:MAG: hypothetical protein JXA61_02450 [Bacteroidales bacterium]|nr:hypothetical protein [Bacteroidales bacterium]
MKVTDLIATALNRRDEEPNQELADKIIRSGRQDWIKELVDNLHHKDKNIQSDCIKVLYEIGERGHPEMIAPYVRDFGRLLESGNNRLVWGAMIALDTVSLINPKAVYALLPDIMQVVDKGSVITIDHGVGILSKLSGISEYKEMTFPLLMEQLQKCPPKQLPMYAERSLMAVDAGTQSRFLDLLQNRITEMEKDSQIKRMEKVMKQVIKQST